MQSCRALRASRALLALIGAFSSQYILKIKNRYHNNKTSMKISKILGTSIFWTNWTFLIILMVLKNILNVAPLYSHGPKDYIKKIYLKS